MDHRCTEQRLIELKKRQATLRNFDFTIFSNNCVGGTIYHDLGLKFLTPIVDLYFYAPDYVKFLANPRHYLNTELLHTKKSKWGSFEFPIGSLDDIELHFLHYSSFEEALQKWEERKKRINYDNLFIIGSEKYGCTPDIIEQFEHLPYERKLFFTTKKYTSFKSTIWLEEYRDAVEVPDIIPERLWLKYIDLIAWLNKEKNYYR